MAVGENAFGSVQWAAASSIEITDTDSPPEKTSDAIDFSATAFMANITCKVDVTTGSATAGDLVTFYVLYSTGNPDGAESEGTNDEYDTDGHKTKLCTIDPNVEDPAIKTVPILPIYRAKIFAVYTVVGTAHMTISCGISEKTA